MGILSFEILNWTNMICNFKQEANFPNYLRMSEKQDDEGLPGLTESDQTLD